MMAAMPGPSRRLDDRLDAARSELTPAERKVAAAVLADRELVAFGTVAAVAERAGASGATVVRLANRLGYDGFRGLQESLRDELTARLRPATEKIRLPASHDVVGRAADAAVVSV